MNESNIRGRPILVNSKLSDVAERGDDGRGVGDAGGLDDEVVGARLEARHAQQRLDERVGDGAADALPIVSLYKTQIRELARHLGINETIIAKKSSPHLWPNHEAEHEIGLEYEQIDAILHSLRLWILA